MHPARPAITALADGVPRLPSLVGYGGLHLIDALRRGAAGVQPGCSFTEVYQRIWRLWQDGDEAAAEALHTRLLPYLTYWMQDVPLIVRVEKVIAHRRGLIRSDHCRAPDRRLDPCELEAVERFLNGFSDVLAPARHGDPPLAQEGLAHESPRLSWSLGHRHGGDADS